jgi:hypothetical protein
MYMRHSGQKQAADNAVFNTRKYKGCQIHADGSPIFSNTLKMVQ